MRYFLTHLIDTVSGGIIGVFISGMEGFMGASLGVGVDVGFGAGVAVRITVFGFDT